MLNQHYSGHIYKDNRIVRLSIGPGEKMVLMTTDGLAVIAWRKFIDKSGQKGVNNCIFQNNSSLLSSSLLLEAEQLAWSRWPGERLYTYVNPRKVSVNPGYCYKMAGWTLVRDAETGTVAHLTIGKKLIILEKFYREVA
jgi:hypothetical protein